MQHALRSPPRDPMQDMHGLPQCEHHAACMSKFAPALKTEIIPE